MSDQTKAFRLPRRHLVAGAVGLVLVGATATSVLGRSVGCQPETIQVSSSTEKSALMYELAADYNDENRRVGALCARVDLSRQTSGATKNELTRPDGNRPEVWLPTSSMWLKLLEQSGSGHVIASAPGPRSITRSTLVLAMPTSVADALEASGQPMQTWEDVLTLAHSGWSAYGKPEWGDFILARDNAETSTSGLAATVATYLAASSGQITEERLRDPEVWQFVHGIESSVSRYGDEAVRYMEEIYAAQQSDSVDRPYVDAIVVEEQMAYMYNQGAPGGDPARINDRRGPRDPLRAVYPKDGTLQLDHPFVVLSSATEAQRAVAEDFYRYLIDNEQQRRFQEVGFRSLDGANRPTEQLTQTLQAPSGQGLRFVPIPDGRLLDAMVRSWDDVRRKASVLLMLDVSDSMNTDVSDPNRALDPSKLELAIPAANRALDLLGDDDEVGLWTFSSNPPWREVMPVSRVGDVRDELKARIQRLTASGNTALYQAIGAASEMMANTANPADLNAIVVLSDGQDTETYPGGTKELLASLDPSRRDTSIRIFTVPYGREKNADIKTLARIARLTGAAQYDARNPLDIEDVFVQVFRNFG